MAKTAQSSRPDNEKTMLNNPDNRFDAVRIFGIENIVQNKCFFLISKKNKTNEPLSSAFLPP